MRTYYPLSCQGGKPFTSDVTAAKIPLCTCRVAPATAPLPPARTIPRGWPYRLEVVWFACLDRTRSIRRQSPPSGHIHDRGPDDRTEWPGVASSR